MWTDPCSGSDACGRILDPDRLKFGMDQRSQQHSDVIAGAPQGSGAGPPGLQLGRGLNMEFRTSRVKVEALDAIRGDLWQTSGSAMDHKSMSNNEDYRRQSPALETASVCDDVVTVKSEEWQGPLPQAVAMRTVETVRCRPAGEVQLNESCIGLSPASAGMPASTAGVSSESLTLESDQRGRTLIISDHMPDTEVLRDRIASVREINLRSSAKQIGRMVDRPMIPVDRLPFGVTRNIIITRADADESEDGRPDGRTVRTELDRPPSSSSDRRSGHEGVDGRTGSVANVGTPPCDTVASEVMACSKKDTCVSGVVQGAQGEINGNPSVSLSGSHFESIQGIHEQVLLSDVRVQSLVEVLHDLRPVDKTEPVAYASLIEEKHSISEFESSGYHSGTYPNHGWERIISTSAPFGQPRASRESVSLPDLNESEGSPPLALKPQLNRLQEAQLRAQILVYGALIHGNQINEPWMETAFGDDIPALNEGQDETHGGRSQWEGRWRTACERIQAALEGIASSTPTAQQRTSRGIMSSRLSQINDLAVASDVPAHPSQELAHPVDTLMSSGASQVVGTEPTAAGLPSGISNAVSSAHPPAAGGNSSVLSPVVVSLDNDDVVTRTPIVATEAMTTVTTGPVGGVVGNISPETVSYPAGGVEHAALTCAENFQDVIATQQPETSDANIEAGNAVSRLGSPPSGKIFSLEEMHSSHVRKDSLTQGWSGLTGMSGAGTSVMPSVIMVAETSTPLILQTMESGPQDHADATGVDGSFRQDDTVEDPSNAAVGRMEASGQTAEGVAAAAGTVPLTAIQNSQPASSSRQQLPPGVVPRLAAPSEAPGAGPMNRLPDRGGFSDLAASQLDQARISAEAAAVAAASAADKSQAVWNRVEAGSPAKLASEQEHQAASAAASLAAAASVAKAAAEIAKMAFEAASLVKEEFEAASQVKCTADETGEASAPCGLGVLHEAREQTMKRAEDAVAAKRRADTLDAIARAAELATEAAAQTGAVISMGDPFPLTLDTLRRDGIVNYWKQVKPPESAGGKRAKAKAVLRKPTKRKAAAEREQAMDVIDDETKRTSKTRSPGKKQISKEIKARLRVAKKKIQMKLKPQAKVKAAPKSRQSAGSVRGPVSKEPVVPSSPLSKNPPSAKQADVIESPLLQPDAGMSDSIHEGAIVEVLGDEDGLRGAWFTGKVVSVRPGEALVEYDEILSDDGSGPLQEWILLGPIGNGGHGAPRVRLAHPVSVSGSQKSRKRRRSDGGNRRWAIGDRVDAWIRDGWWEGLVTAVNNEDETKITVHFPGEGDTSVMKSWDLRPTLVWRDGNWKEFQPDMDEAGRPAKQQKVSAQVTRVQPSKEKGKNEGLRTSRAGGKGGSVIKPGKHIPEPVSEVRAAEERKDTRSSSKKRKQAEASEDVVGKTSTKKKTPSRGEQESAHTVSVNVTPASEKEKPKRALKTRVPASIAKSPGTGIPETARRGVGQNLEVGASTRTSNTGAQAKVAGSSKASVRGKKAVNAKRSTKTAPAKEKDKEAPAVAEIPSVVLLSDSSPELLESLSTPGRQVTPENATRGSRRGVSTRADADEGDAAPSANSKGKQKQAQKGSKVKTAPQKDNRRKSSRKGQVTRKV